MNLIKIEEYVMVGMVLCGLLVITSTSWVPMVLGLILLFISGGFLLVMLQMEFIAIIYLVVYIGALCVLFLYVILLLNLRQLDSEIEMKIASVLKKRKLIVNFMRWKAKLRSYLLVLTQAGLVDALKSIVEKVKRSNLYVIMTLLPIGSLLAYKLGIIDDYYNKFLGMLGINDEEKRLVNNAVESLRMEFIANADVYSENLIKALVDFLSKNIFIFILLGLLLFVGMMLPIMVLKNISKIDYSKRQEMKDSLFKSLLRSLLVVKRKNK
jgi:hypothetical protein